MQKVTEKSPLQYFETMVLYCLARLKGERTIYSIFHLFKGKRSAQTIQDAHLYSLSALFHSFGALERKDLERVVSKLLHQNLISEMDSQRYSLTNDGNRYLSSLLKQSPLPPHLDGLKYNQLGRRLWERLSLLVQVCSYISRNDSNYIPIQKGRDAQQWIKSLFKNMNPQDRGLLPAKLLKELKYVLEEGRGIRPDILVLRLSGYRAAGLTTSQAARELEMDEFYCHLEFLGVLHYLCKMLAEKPENYPLLTLLAGDAGEELPLTQSAKQTYKFLKEGLSIESIAAVRGLKSSTVEDHIVEITLNIPGFPIEPFVTADEIERIIELSSGLATRQLRVLKEKAGGITYFKIRLILAKFGER
ncbi:helix-turn-helix domain-containing protein [Bacillus sp. B-jedd]|uniref:helix-turn-helix domain-containing protein n=1 Tax=Bacillus sp. B-jedd TaxID=1476857 RepID=UPI0005156AA9|nr:helix-turn-helix domain-containing protein [Bacillus sp. B-jedd]CEG27690.1 ATP-dependent DNA helicase recq [Bacillus sp. B-jedd]